ncbi:IS1/IS1595 family N-terminal zinc-binding domain-containing protein [Flavobacterium aciduliphilum]|uniref:InsA-like protein n=1 Tax=Flavobacterium aciduliphilum TaxID=1101402 RepID=A0A328YZA2_9FLAO|nr:hypothetical protein CLV55_101101 [Flavobacterium aciduliphilum]
MILKETSCVKVSDTQICPKCKSKAIIKNGFTKNRKQQYHCKSCTTRLIDYYTNKACLPTTNNNIIRLTKEGLSIQINMMTQLVVECVLIPFKYYKI